MPMSHPEIRSFRGLYKQANTFEVPDGAMEIAQDVVITRDGTITKRRGFYTWHTPGAGTLNKLFNYRDKIIALKEASLERLDESGTSPNETGSATALTGATIDVSGGRVSQSVQTNQNLYFTTNDGIRKIESESSSIFDAGIPQAMDLRGALITGTFLDATASDAYVYYRILFGRKDENDNLLLGAPSDFFLIGASSGAGTRGVRLEFTVPDDLNATDGYFYQIYRSDQSATTPPDIDLKLVTEENLTASDISQGYVMYDDNLSDILRGAFLYTNPNSGEGELQANLRPPLCDDAELYKSHVIYAKCTRRHFFDLSVIDPSLFAANDEVHIRVGGTLTKKYIARDGLANRTDYGASWSVAGSTVTVTTSANHALVIGDTVQINNATGGTPPSTGTKTITAVTATTYQFTEASLSGSGTLDTQGYEDTNGDKLFSFDTVSATFAERVDNTARALVKAIARDASSSDGGLVGAEYTSQSTDAPGNLRVFARGFDGAVELAVDTAGHGAAFFPALTTTFANNAASGEDQPHIMYISKIGEPEAVPLINSFAVGAKNKDILRVLALRDSLIILKEDGVYRMTGDLVSNFVITALDNTVRVIAAGSADVINNQVVFLSDQGICLVTESSVRVISRKIEDDIQPIVGLSNIASITGAVAYESERMYLISTADPGESTKTTTYAYNTLNDSWTEWTQLFNQGVIGPDDVLYLVSDGNTILKERKKHTKIDYSGTNHSITVNTVAADGLSGTITSGTTPEKGWIVVKDNVINRISSVTGTSSPYTVTFSLQTNLEAADTPIMYEAYKSIIKFSPYHAGLVGRFKQFSEMQIHMRGPDACRLNIFFSGPYFGSSELVEWLCPTLTGGWGNDFWEFFPWGQGEGITITSGTAPAPIVRTYVPSFAQRGTFIQPTIEHYEAGEPLNFQALAYSVRAYSQRVSI